MGLKLEEELGVIFCKWENYRFIFVKIAEGLHYAMDGAVKVASAEDCRSNIELNSKTVDKIVNYKFQVIEEELSMVTVGNFYIADCGKFNIQTLYLPHSEGLRAQFFIILKRINCFIKFVHENEINLVEYIGEDLDSIFSIKENKLELLNKLAEERTNITLVCGKIRVHGTFIKQRISSGSETWEEYWLGAGEEDCIVEIPCKEITESEIINIYQYYNFWQVEIYP